MIDKSVTGEERDERREKRKRRRQRPRDRRWMRTKRFRGSLDHTHGHININAFGFVENLIYL